MPDLKDLLNEKQSDLTRQEKSKLRMRGYVEKYGMSQYQRIVINNPKRMFTLYQRDAERRNICFEISFDEFFKFWDKPCNYCGGDKKGIGLDRVDNERGYIYDNLVSCCKFCNYAKKDSTTEVFLEYLERVTNFIISKRKLVE